MSKKIPDVSHHHPVDDWDLFKNNVSFAISKATERTDYIDPTLDSFIKGCESHKIPYWLYVYLNGKQGNELEQARFLVKTCNNKVGPYFRGYILDVEDGNSANNVKEALNYISKNSEKCMIYTYYSQYNKYKDVINSRPSNCAWWEARTGKNNGSYSPDYPCHAGVDLHQFTSKGQCPGVSGKIDLNRLNALNGLRVLSWFTNKTSIPEPEVKVSYYKKYTGKSIYIDSVFKAIGVPAKYRGSYTKRKPVAKANGLSGYSGTSSQNLKLIELAKKGKLIKP